MGLRLLVKAEYHWTGSFERNIFFVEGKSGIKYRCGVTGALPQSFKYAAEYPVNTLANLGQLVTRKSKEVEIKEKEIPMLAKIKDSVWTKTHELAELKTECKILQEKIDASLKAMEEEVIPVEEVA